MIINWIQNARWASSADNLQPWEVKYNFTRSSVIIQLSLAAGTLAQPSEIDSNWTLSYLALGCLAKNIDLLAQCDGYGISKIEASKNSPNSFIVKLIPMESHVDPLVAWIQQRGTQRIPFSKSPLKPEHIEELKKLNTQTPFTKLQFFPQEENQPLRKYLIQLDQYRYTEKSLFLSFLKTLRLDPKKQDVADGLLIKNLSIPFIFTQILRLTQKFNFLWMMNLLGSQKISTWLGCTRLLNNSAGLISLQASVDSPLHWFCLGMDLQTFWLKANSLGISVQVFGNTLLLYRAHLESQKMMSNLKPFFSTKKISRLAQIKNQLLNETQLNAEHPLLIIRVGYLKTSQKNESPRRDITPFRDPQLLIHCLRSRHSSERSY